MSIRTTFNPLGTLGAVLPQWFPLRQHVITGRVNGRTIGLNYEGERVVSYGSYATVYEGVALGYGFAAVVMVRGQNEPAGSTLSIDVRAPGQPINQAYTSSVSIGAFTASGAYDLQVGGYYGATMQTPRAYNELDGTLRVMPKTGGALVRDYSRLTVPTYSHALLFDRELTAPEFAVVLAALRQIAI